MPKPPLANFIANFIAYVEARQGAGKPVLVSTNDIAIFEQIGKALEREANARGEQTTD